MEHPEVKLKLHSASQKSKSIDITGVADTGAQSDLWSLEQFLNAGFTKEDLSPVSLSLFAANRSPIKMSGAFRANLEGKFTQGTQIRCSIVIYISLDV